MQLQNDTNVQCVCSDVLKTTTLVDHRRCTPCIKQNITFITLYMDAYFLLWFRTQSKQEQAEHQFLPLHAEIGEHIKITNTKCNKITETWGLKTNDELFRI